MKIYFAGPLFTPYVRKFISENATILRDNGFDPFVPHENIFGSISPETVKSLQDQGLLPIGSTQQSNKSALDVAVEMVRSGDLTREQAGLPPITASNVFEVDYDGLSSADVVLAILDGTQVDDGTACELGIFYGLSRSDPSKKGIVGLMTDSRGIRKKENGYGLNYFVLGILEEFGVVVNNFQDALLQLQRWDDAIKASHSNPQNEFRK